MRILLVEDDQLAAKLVKAGFGPAHYVVTVDSIEAARELARGQRWDLALVDLNLKLKLDGLTLIPDLKKLDIFTVVMSGHEEEDIIDACYQAGCDDYFAKGELEQSIPQLLQHVVTARKSALPDRVFETSYITQDEDTRRAARTLMQALENATTGLVLGETGTGKSELVKTLFSHAGLEGNIVEINCAALPRDLIEAELFGHEKGSFTGAEKARVGKIKHADKGLLFLDEVGCLPLEAQAKLLKVLEEKKFQAIGSVETQRSHFRLIAATNEDLFALVAKGLFRMDLLQRLCGSVVTLKPLRQRPNDVWALLRHLPSGARRLSFSARAKELLNTHRWPGNIRELRRLHEHCLQASTGRIDEALIEAFLKQSAPAALSALPGDLTDLALHYGLDELCERIRQQVIQSVLKRNQGHMAKTMKDLGVSSRQYYKYQRPEGSEARHVH